MASPSCPKCDGTKFELNLIEPKKARYKMYAINCSSCGAVVSVTDFHDIAARLDKMDKRIGVNLDL